MVQVEFVHLPSVTGTFSVTVETNVLEIGPSVVG